MSLLCTGNLEEEAGMIYEGEKKGWKSVILIGVMILASIL